jgi:hypothetical protein
MPENDDSQIVTKEELLGEEFFDDAAMDIG